MTLYDTLREYYPLSWRGTVVFLVLSTLISFGVLGPIEAFSSLPEIDNAMGHLRDLRINGIAAEAHIYLPIVKKSGQHIGDRDTGVDLLKGIDIYGIQVGFTSPTTQTLATKEILMSQAELQKIQDSQGRLITSIPILISQDGRTVVPSVCLEERINAIEGKRVKNRVLLWTGIGSLVISIGIGVYVGMMRYKSTSIVLTHNEEEPRNGLKNRRLSLFYTLMLTVVIAAAATLIFIVCA